MIALSPEIHALLILEMNDWLKSQIERIRKKRREKGAVRHGERQKLDNPTPEGLTHMVSYD
jgi:hypothetical protein